MDRTLRYHHDFDADVIEAAQWYATGSRELALDFISKVEQAIAKIFDDPASRSMVDFGLRYWPVERFHVVFFDFTDLEVFLIGVMHPSQQAGRWIRRNR